MALANCPLCGKLFNKTLRDVCSDCIRAEDEQFKKVRDYLREHHNAKPNEVSDATDVPLGTIYKFLKEGRLIASYYPGMHYECEKCGAPITKGKFCDNCIGELNNTINKLKEVVEKEKKITQRENSKSAYYSRYDQDQRKK